MSFGIVFSVIGKALVTMGMKLLAEEFIEDIIIWGAKKLAASTKSKADDELVARIEQQLKSQD